METKYLTGETWFLSYKKQNVTVFTAKLYFNKFSFIKFIHFCNNSYL